MSKRVKKFSALIIMDFIIRIKTSLCGLFFFIIICILFYSVVYDEPVIGERRDICRYIFNKSNNKVVEVTATNRYLLI